MKRPSLSVLIGVGLAAAITTRAQPRITSQPGDTVGDIGGAVSFTVRAAPQVSGDTLTYQWSHNGVALEGETSSQLPLNDLGAEQKGNYAVTVTDSTGSVTSRTVALTLFARITSGNPIVESGTTSWCAAWGDMDGDGDLDLFVADGGGSDSWDLPNHLYRNEGGGVFRELEAVEAGSAVEDRASSIGCAWADYDNDGDLDLYVVNIGDWTFPGLQANDLYRNDGEGRFTRMTDCGPLVTEAKAAWALAWEDYDRDGYLDLFVSDARAARFVPNYYDTDSLYHNLQDGTFERDDGAGITSVQGIGQSAAWADFDNDGDRDLIVSHSTVQTMYVNNGDGTFTPMTSGPHLGLTTWIQMWAWGDFTGDGWFDLAASDYFEGSFKLLLFENDRAGGFALASVTALSSSVTGHQTTCADYDNDGDLDVFVARGEEGRAVNDLLQNDGTGHFTRITNVSVSSDIGSSLLGPWADYDNNGFPDLVVCNIRGEANFLYRNEGNSNHYVVFSLVGTRSNRCAIGAKIRVLATIDGESRWQVREIRSAYGRSGLRAHFGLGDAESVEAVRIQWPSGITQELGNLEIDQFLTITEPPQVHMSEPGALTVLGGRGMTCEVFGSPNLVDWTSLGPVTLSGDGTATFQDDGANGLAHRFYYVEQ